MLMTLQAINAASQVFFLGQFLYINRSKMKFVQLINMKKFELFFVMFFIFTFLRGSQAQKFVSEDLADPWLKELQFPRRADKEQKKLTDDYKKLSSAIDILFNWKIQPCPTCQSLKFFAIRPLSSASQYLTVSSTCSGTVSFSPAPVSGRPGNNQLLVATQLSDETWLLEPSICLGRYIKATSASTLAVLPGLSSNARHWIEYHDNHVHLQSAFYMWSYWQGGLPIQIGGGASSYIVEYWPSRPWP